MTVGSLFSGIGGLDLGLARAGFRHAFFCESDPWRRDVLAAHWPGVPVFGDVRDVAGHGDWTQLAALSVLRMGEGREVRMPDADRRGQTLAQGSAQDVSVVATQPERGDSGARSSDAALTRDGSESAIDLLCGGFPCQDVSVAGRRAGLAGARSGLFHEFARIAESLRPRWLLVENVPGLLSSNGGRDFGVVLGTLADLGYGLGWRILDSRFFGVPQRRRRVFVVGALAVGDPRAAAERAGAVLAVGSRCPRHPATRGEAGEDPAGTSRNGVEVSGTLEFAGSGKHNYGVDNVTGYVAVSENQRAEVLETDYARQLTSGGGKPGQGYSMTRQGSSVRRLTPTECERLQALPDGWTAHGPDSRRYAALGDAVTASVGEWIGRRLLEAA